MHFMQRNSPLPNGVSPCALMPAARQTLSLTPQVLRLPLRTGATSQPQSLHGHRMAREFHCFVKDVADLPRLFFGFGVRFVIGLHVEAPIKIAIVLCDNRKQIFYCALIATLFVR